MMLVLKKSSRLALLFIAAFSLPAFAGEIKTIDAEGVAELKGDAPDIARDAALKDAQQRAVEQAISILVDPQTRVENHQPISDRILSRTARYIKKYEVTNVMTDSGLLRVRISAIVALGPLSEELSAIGLHVSQAQKLRSVNITVTGLDKTRFDKFKDMLLNQVSSIKNLRERSFNGATAMITVDSINSAQVLSKELLLRDFGGFSVEVTGSTANSLELKATPE